MMRLVDILYALPFMIFIVLLMVVFGRNMLLLFLAIGAVEWLTMARIMRCQVQSLRQQEFVEAAISLGLSPATIIRRHLVPNALGPIIVYTTLTIPSVMLLEAFLSFPGPGCSAAANLLGPADFLRRRNHGGVSLAAAVSRPRTDPDPVFPKFSRRRTARCAGRARRQGLTPWLCWRQSERQLCHPHGHQQGGGRYQLHRGVGKITAIIGESGSGKSVACYSLLGLIPNRPGASTAAAPCFRARTCCN